MTTHLNRHLFTLAFWLGLLALVWVGAGFIGSHPLALAMTLVIAAVYGLGALELYRFRQATAALNQALAALSQAPAKLNDWLAGVPVSLQNPVRLRIEGERVGLPGPALTPYLVGLLVMLGMLGTFLGLVVTLNGAVFALEGSTDLQGIRSALAAPIKGLGLAFGTSVAGVAASAMLGLMSALCRRERLQAGQQLDSHIGTVLRGFSLTHQRQETFKAVQAQAQAMPELVTQLQAMMAHMQQMNQQLNQSLLGNQDRFHSHIQSVYTELARSVDQSLHSSLSQGAQMASDAVQPVVETAMKAIAQEARHMHERLLAAGQIQLSGVSAQLGASATAMADTWSAALARHEQANVDMVAGVGQSLEAFNHNFAQRSSALVSNVDQAYCRLQAEAAAQDQQRLQAWTESLQHMATNLHSQWQHSSAQTLQQQQRVCDTLTQTAQDITKQAQSSASSTLGEISRLSERSEELMHARIAAEAKGFEQHSQGMDQLAALLRRELSALRDDESVRGAAAVQRLGDLQTAVASHLTTLGTALEQPLTRLLQTASEAPRAAAEVIGQLRLELSASSARDNALLEERSRILATLNSLLDSIHHASAEQRAVIDTLVASSAVALNAAGQQFAEKMGTETAKLSDMAAHVTSSAVEVSSLSEAFSLAVRSFGAANDKLIANLQRIEAAMDKSMLRSDEQLAYYVAQAREVIDLSMSAQKDIFDQLRQLPARPTRLAQEVL